MQFPNPMDIQTFRLPLRPVQSQRPVSNAADHRRNVMDADDRVKYCLTIRSGMVRRSGAPGRTRTCDPKLRRLVLYPAELRAPTPFLARPARCDRPSPNSRGRPPPALHTWARLCRMGSVSQGWEPGDASLVRTRLLQGEVDAFQADMSDGAQSAARRRVSVVLVTGADRGIGNALCRACHTRGDDVIAACLGTSDELRAPGIRVEPGVDVTLDDAVRGLAPRRCAARSRPPAGSRRRPHSRRSASRHRRSARPPRAAPGR